MRKVLSALWALAKLALIASVVWLASCTTTRTILQQAPTIVPDNDRALRAPLARDIARAQLQTYMYGAVDRPTTARLSETADPAPRTLNGAATLYNYELFVTYGAKTRPLDVVLLLPNGAPDAPIIMAQNFCPNAAVVNLPDVVTPAPNSFCNGGGLMGGVMTYAFGRYIVEPPLADIIARGYGFAAVFPSQIVPDDARLGTEALDAMFPNNPDRPGALAIWAGLFEALSETLQARHGDRTMIAYGHSRFGKTALMAGAWFDDIDIVVAHQSGTLGASDLSDRSGESVSDIIRAYPHWGGASLAADNIPRQANAQDLLGLLSDKPVLLGNARRDVWSDPLGAFRAAKSAWPDTMSAEQPGTFMPTDRHAYWLRPGTHGVVKEDWPAFLDFLDAQTVAK